ERTAAMADAIFFLESEFGASTLQARIEEQRVVAEAARSARCAQDLAMPDAFGNQRLWIVGVAQKYDDAVIVRAAVGTIGKQFEQVRVVSGVRLWFAGEAGRVHAGRPVECIDADSRIIGQGRQARVQRSVPGPRQRILDEGRMRFLGFAHVVEHLGNHLEVERGQDRRDLADVAHVVARQYQTPHGRCHSKARNSKARNSKAWNSKTRNSMSRCRTPMTQSPSAERCSAISRPIPIAASSIMASSWVRENGTPSAVPCNSTIPPAP